jgi:hypothetical protein
LLDVQCSCQRGTNYVNKQKIQFNPSRTVHLRTEEIQLLPYIKLHW